MRAEAFAFVEIAQKLQALRAAVARSTAGGRATPNAGTIGFMAGAIALR